MNRRLVGIGLGLLTVALFIGPIAYAFYSHGWDLKETVAPSGEQIKNIQESIQGAAGGGGSLPMGDLKVVENEITKDSISIGILFPSPFEFPASLENMKWELIHNVEGKKLATLTLQQDNVKLIPGENTQITLAGSTTSDGEKIIENSSQQEILMNMGTGDMIFVFEAYGITVELNMGGR